MAAAIHRRTTSLARLGRALPRGLRERLERARHDLRMIGLALRGEAPPHLVPRRDDRSWTTPPRRSVIAWQSLPILDVVRETKDATTLVLGSAAGSTLEFQAGQFLTVEVEIDGETLRRAYSLSSAPSDGRLSITVKRVAGGRVSNFLNDHVVPGSVLRVRGPSGTFAAPAHARHLVLLAGGSGITPLYAIAREVLGREAETRVTLIYGNRGADDVIFAEALGEMEHEEPRFAVDRVLSEPPEGFAGARGMLDRAMVDARLDVLGIDPASASFLICGPEPMRVACRRALEARGVPAEEIREEIFVRPELRDDGARLPTEKVGVRVRIGDDEREVIVAPGRTLLEAGLSAGASMPFSCTMGGCAACKLRLTSGEVRMEEPNCLTSSEREAGYVLTCVSRPLGPCSLEADP